MRVGVAGPDTAAGPGEDVRQAHWSPATRVGYRFCVVYFGLFCLTSPQLPLSFTGGFRTSLPPDILGRLITQLSPIYETVGRTVFGVTPVVHEGGSGDQTVMWVLLFAVFVAALIITVVWSLLDRHRREYRRQAQWSRLALRLVVAATVLYYGMGKVIPIQMPAPALTTLLEPYGNLTPMAVLWNQVGVSQPYQILLGLAEVLGALLLFVPRTAIAGALLCLVSMAQVFVLNLTFDVPVKIVSGHLMLMCLALLAPQARRLTDVLLLDRDPGPRVPAHPFRTAPARRAATIVQAALAIWLLAGNAYDGSHIWREYGDGRAEPPLYGIWAVRDFVRDGQPLPPLTTDETRWRRIVFDTPGIMHYQRMDDRLVPATLAIDTESRRMQLTTPDSTPLAEFSYDRPTPDRLTLTGNQNGHPLTITLDRIDPNSFPQRDADFRWIQDTPRR